MSPETLRDGYRYANRRFYSGASLYRRLTPLSPVGLWWTLPLNLAYAFALRSGQQGETAHGRSANRIELGVPSSSPPIKRL